MKISLNEMVELLSEMAGRPFDVPLQEELKVILNYKRADWMNKIIEKHPDQRKYFIKYISDTLVDVDRAECPAPSTGCTVRRTTNKIPLPLRTSYALFDYVGDTDKLDGYTYLQPDQLLWMVRYGSKYTKDRPKYHYANGYVYIYNEDYMEDVTIGGIWPDQRQLNDFKCDDQACYTDNDQYEIADDILNTMVQDVLKNELRLLTEQDQTEIPITQNIKQ